MDRLTVYSLSMFEAVFKLAYITNITKFSFISKFMLLDTLGDDDD